MDAKQIGIRAQDIHTGTQDHRGPLLSVWYTTTRLVGMAAKLAVNIRGLDVITNIQQLFVVADQLGVDGPNLQSVLGILQEVGWVKIDKLNHKIVKVTETVPYFSDAYDTLGEYWKTQDASEIEEATLKILGDLAKSPRSLEDIKVDLNLDDDSLEVIMQVGEDGSFLKSYQVDGGKILYSPLFWDEKPNELFRVLRKYKLDEIVSTLERVKANQGLPVDPSTDPLLQEAAVAGVLPAPAVSSVGGTKLFAFTPYAGAIPIGQEENQVLDKARSILACVRYGQNFAGASRIKWPRAILETLLDPSRGRQLKAHTEHKYQYSLLAFKQIVQIIPVSSGSEWHYVRLIETPDNIKAMKIALDLLDFGEQMTNKGLDEDARKLLAFKGEYIEPMRALRQAKQQSPSASSSFVKLLEIARGGGGVIG